MMISITVDTAEPLTGVASSGGREPVSFVGWLQLLRAVAELVGTTGTAGDTCQGDASQAQAARGARGEDPTTPVLPMHRVGDLQPS